MEGAEAVGRQPVGVEAAAAVGRLDLVAGKPQQEAEETAGTAGLELVGSVGIAAGLVEVAETRPAG